MQNLIAPYADTVFPIEYLAQVVLPKGAMMNVKTNQKVEYKDLLASSRYSKILEHHILNVSDPSQRWNVVDGEFVRVGDTLTLVKRGLRWNSGALAKNEGTVRIEGNKLMVLKEEEVVEMKTGFVGEIREINLRKNSFKTLIKGACIKYIYAENATGYSGVVDSIGDSEVRFVSHEDGALHEFIKPNVLLYIFDYLTNSEFKKISEQLSRANIGFCILGSQDNSTDLDKKVNLMLKVSGKRIFIEDGFLAATCWKARSRSKYFSVIKGNSRVMFKDFKKEKILGKIIELKDKSATVLTDSGKKETIHYLNLWKE